MDDTAMQCIFCRIVGGWVESATVYEDDATLVFLDHRPLFPGHCLVIPKEHYETLTDLPADLVGVLFTRAQLVARAVELAMEADGTFVAVNNRVSQSVPHVHVHVVPRRWHDGLRGFFWPRQPYSSQAEMAGIQAAIKAAIDKLRAASE